MFDDNGNGHNETLSEGLVKNAAQSAQLDLEEIRERGGIFANLGASQSQSLLHRIITPTRDNKGYRDELKTANWSTPDEADDAVAALEECFELGMDATPIIDQIIARNAGIKHELLRMITETLTHSTFNVNEQKGKYSRGNGKQSNSPISQ